MQNSKWCWNGINHERERNTQSQKECTALDETAELIRYSGIETDHTTDWNRTKKSYFFNAFHVPDGVAIYMYAYHKNF